MFDLDGTLYPKESDITHEIRKRVVHLIASRNAISIEAAKDLYARLPLKYPNPYDGLASVNVTGTQYQEIYNSLDIDYFIARDERLVELFRLLSGLADIVFVSFAPQLYVKRMLKAFGIELFVQDVVSVSKSTSYSKELIFFALDRDHRYVDVVAIGDDEENDLVPARKAGFKTHYVDFGEVGLDIYSVINRVYDYVNDKHIPRTMRIENISSCNEKCTICPYGELKRKKGIMSDELYEKLVIEHSSSVDNPKLIFPASIGEPFLDGQFLDKISFARKYYCNIATFSNASVLSKDIFLRYIQCGGSELMLTLHGFTENMHAKITRSNLYRIVRTNIEDIAALNYSVGSPIKIYLDIYAEESVECLDYINMMVKLGVKAYRFDMEATHNWGGRVNGYSKRVVHNYCNRIYEQFGVQHNGNVVPCCTDVEGQYILGNANHQTLSQIFASKRYFDLVKAERRGTINDNPLCALCNV